MQLTKSEALYIYSALSHYESTTENDRLLFRLKSFLVGDDASSGEDIADVDSTDDSGEYETVLSQEFVADAQINGSVLHELPAHNVVTPTGDTTTLEFEQDDEDDCVNALFYGGSLVIEDIQGLKLCDSQDKLIQLFDGEEWHNYPVNRFAKAWLNKFNLNDTYQVV